MNLSSIKLIATDMDGTLLNSNHEVSNWFFEIFKELKKHKIVFVVASGRPYYSIVNKLKAIQHEIIIVAENGGIVIDNETVLLSTPLIKNNLVEIEKLINKFSHIHSVFCTKSKAYFKDTSNENINVLSEFWPNYEIINSIMEIEEDIIKISLYDKDNSEKNIYPHFKHFRGNYKVTVSGQHWVDISHILANKGYAIKMLQKKHNINRNETMAFGDYDNDIEMLEQAAYRFAVENANSKIKDKASYYTKSNDEYGVEVILNTLLEAKNKTN